MNINASVAGFLEILIDLVAVRAGEPAGSPNINPRVTTRPDAEPSQPDPVEGLAGSDPREPEPDSAEPAVGGHARAHREAAHVGGALIGMVGFE